MGYIGVVTEDIGIYHIEVGTEGVQMVQVISGIGYRRYRGGVGHRGVATGGIEI